jgi:hypothetical protein
VSGVHTPLDRRGQHERLERRARLAPPLRDEVVLVLLRVRRDGDHRAIAPLLGSIETTADDGSVLYGSVSWIARRAAICSLRSTVV